LPYFALFCPILPYFALFCPILPYFALFCPILPYFALFCPILPYFAYFALCPLFCPILPNTRLLTFGRSLGSYVQQLVNFQSFNTEEKPFPFNDWPT